MKRLKRLAPVLLFLAALAFSVGVLGTLGCAQVPPNLTPEASVAFQTTRAVRALDLLRDVAIAAHAQTPPVLTEATTRRVVLYHQSIVKIVQASPNGWRQIAEDGLTELVANLPDKERSVVSPYVALVKTIIREVR